MLVGFIGIPSSGKTTLAAEAFVHLKKMGVVSEFVVEIARQHIAKKRQANPSSDVVLTDADQVAIMVHQGEAEELMDMQDTICISDSSPINSLMYMSDAVRDSDDIQDLFFRAALSYDILVICEEATEELAPDANRVHGLEHRARLAAARDELVLKIRKTKLPGLMLLTTNLSDTDFAKTLSFIAVDKFFSLRQEKEEATS